MDHDQVKRALIEFKSALYHEGFIDGQFGQLEQLQDDTSPNFVIEVVSLFFEDSDRLINDMTLDLSHQKVDFRKIDAHVHQFKGSSASVGAQRLKNICISFRKYCEEENLEACMRCLQHVKQELKLLKNKLNTMFKLQREVYTAPLGVK